MSLERKTYTVEEAAAILGISRGLAYEEVRAGRIPSIRVKNRLLVPMERLDDFLRGDGERHDHGAKGAA